MRLISGIRLMARNFLSEIACSNRSMIHNSTFCFVCRPRPAPAMMTTQNNGGGAFVSASGGIKMNGSVTTSTAPNPFDTAWALRSNQTATNPFLLNNNASTARPGSAPTSQQPQQFSKEFEISMWCHQCSRVCDVMFSWRVPLFAETIPWTKARIRHWQCLCSKLARAGQ